MKHIFLIVFILFLSDISAIFISEIEINPLGVDSGNEWIEFYSEEEINLENYTLKNNDGDFIFLNFRFKGYFVFSLEKQWLDNSDEKVFLYRGETLINETEIFEDSLNDEFTWQLCDKWGFLDVTKGEKNDCKEEMIEETKTEEIIEEDSFKEKEIEAEKETPKVYEDIKQNNITNVTHNPIRIESKSIKSEEDKENYKNNYAKYGLLVFCILIGFLLIKKNKKYQEDEFKK